MNIKLAVLRVSPGEFTLILFLVVAAAVHMIEGKVPNGAPAIGDEYGRHEAWHSQLVKRNAKVRKKTHNTYENIPAFIPLFYLLELNKSAFFIPESTKNRNKKYLFLPAGRIHFITQNRAFTPF